MSPEMRFLAAFSLILGYLLVAPGNASAAEPAWWTAQKRSCHLSPSLVYNSWDGKCNSSSGGVQDGGYTPQQQMILNSAQQMMPLLQQAVHDAVYGNPQEQARKAQEAERIRILQQQADEEALRQQELAKQRILGLLKGVDEYKPLAIKRDESSGAPAGSNIALLKLGEPANPTDASSARARRGFDTAGPMQGAVLPPPSPTPASTSTQTPDQSQSELLKALQAKLDQSAKDQKFLDELLATLKKSPKADPVLVKQVQQKIDSNTRDLNAVAEQIRAAEQAAAEPNRRPMAGNQVSSASSQGADKAKSAANTVGSKAGSAGFSKGFEAASQCYSQNAGPACVGVGADQQQACVAGYRAGYEAGDRKRQQVMDEAYRAGSGAGAAGGLANGASDPRAQGPCRVPWIEAYNRGYFQSKNAATR
jgi:hypothetical protein